jgi:hypothetical protein
MPDLDSTPPNPSFSAETGVPDTAYEAALKAAFPGLPPCVALDEARRRTYAAVDAVWPLALAAGVAEGRRQAAEAIRAEYDRVRPEHMRPFDGLVGMATGTAYANAARVAEGKEDGHGDTT